MKTPTRVGRSVVVGLALSAGLVTSVAAHPGGVAAATGSATFSDSAGDSGAAPDLTSVTINGDPATRTLTLTVTAAGYLPATPDAMERDIDVFLDTDRNDATGAPCGCDYALGAFNDSTGRYWDLGRWDGSAWKSVPQSATMGVARLTWTPPSVGHWRAHADFWGTLTAAPSETDNATIDVEEPLPGE